MKLASSSPRGVPWISSAWGPICAPPQTRSKQGVGSKANQSLWGPASCLRPLGSSMGELAMQHTSHGGRGSSQRKPQCNGWVGRPHTKSRRHPSLSSRCPLPSRHQGAMAPLPPTSLCHYHLFCTPSPQLMLQAKCEAGFHFTALLQFATEGWSLG